MNAHIVLLPGDGIGPEVVKEARLVLEAVAKRHGHQFKFTEHLLGGCAIDAKGTAMPDETLAACQAADAVLLGAVGGPKWDDPAAKVRPEQGLLGLRKGMQLYANLRPVRPMASLEHISPLKPDRIRGVDFLVVRELTGGLYFGARGRKGSGENEQAFDTMIYSRSEIRRVVKLAFQLAKGRRGLVTSIDKANVLESSRLWRQVAVEVGKDNPGVKLEHQLVDSAAMRLVTHAAQFDVLVTENMFGDILTDEAAVLAGSLGLLPSASLGDGRTGPVRADSRLGSRYCRARGSPIRLAQSSQLRCFCVIPSVSKKRPRKLNAQLRALLRKAITRRISDPSSHSPPPKWGRRCSSVSAETFKTRRS